METISQIEDLRQIMVQMGTILREVKGNYYAGTFSYLPSYANLGKNGLHS